MLNRFKTNFEETRLLAEEGASAQLLSITSSAIAVH